MKQSNLFIRYDFHSIFMQIDAQSEILWDFEFLEKCLWQL